MKNENLIVWLIFLGTLAMASFFIFRSIYSLSVASSNLLEKSNLIEIKLKEKDTSFEAIFLCKNNKDINALFTNKEEISRVLIKINEDTSYDLEQVISASGARYANTDESFVFWNKGNTAFIEENGEITFEDCVLKEEEIKDEDSVVNNNDVIVGGDRDEHGCIGSAGYTYCVAKDKCIRSWEEECEKVNDKKIILDSKNKEDSCVKNGGIYFKDSKVCEINSFSESTCLAKGGEYNPCASACRHNKEAVVCTLQCVLTCSFK